MFHNVLVPTDGSALATEAIANFALLMASVPDSQVTILIAIASRRAEDTDESEAWVAQENLRLRAKAEETLAVTGAIFAERGISATPLIIEGSPASAVIAEEACRGRYDLLVMTSRGLGAGRSERYYLGSVTENVLKKVNTPVLVIPIHPIPIHPDGRLNLTQGDIG